MTTVTEVTTILEWPLPEDRFIKATVKNDILSSIVLHQRGTTIISYPIDPLYLKGIHTALGELLTYLEKK